MDAKSQEFKDQSVCIVGLGYVGLTLAVTMADVGFDVIGVEVRDSVLDLLAQSKPHFFEPGLEEKLRRLVLSKRISFAKKIPSGWHGSVFIITVGTPLDSAGKSRMDMITQASQEVAEHLKSNDLIIMRSTVKLGTTRQVVLPILQAKHLPFDIAFCPERTLEGKALKELRHLPQVIGGINPQSSVRAAQFFQHITPTVVRVSNPETAELIKLVDNAQRDVQFAYANEVARICDALNISAREVIESGKLGYPRTNLPMPGPVGGPCLEKDSHILAEGLEGYDIKPELTLAGRVINERQPQETIGRLTQYCKNLIAFPAVPRIVLLGLAFKGRPATDDLRGTTAKPIFAQLRLEFPEGEFFGYDPVVSEKDIHEFGLQPCSTLSSAFDRANLVLILNNHPVFTDMAIESLSKDMAEQGVIYDYWNGFNAMDLNLANDARYLALGSGFLDSKERI